MADVTIETIKNGPYIVKGAVELIDADGNAFPVEKRMALCRCGASTTQPVTDEYQGVKVEDNYQWLEQDDDPAVKAWSDAQSRRTREYLDKLPDRAAIEKQLTDWYAKTSPSYSGIVSRPGILFARTFQPPKQQQMLVTLASAEDLKSERMVLDPNKL